jgi:hypothetical protein
VNPALKRYVKVPPGWGGFVGAVVGGGAVTLAMPPADGRAIAFGDALTVTFGVLRAVTRVADTWLVDVDAVGALTAGSDPTGAAVLDVVASVGAG